MIYPKEEIKAILLAALSHVTSLSAPHQPLINGPCSKTTKQVTSTEALVATRLHIRPASFAVGDKRETIIFILWPQSVVFGLSTAILFPAISYRGSIVVSMTFNLYKIPISVCAFARVPLRSFVKYGILQGLSQPNPMCVCRHH